MKSLERISISICWLLVWAQVVPSGVGTNQLGAQLLQSSQDSQVSDFLGLNELRGLSDSEGGEESAGSQNDDSISVRFNR